MKKDILSESIKNNLKKYLNESLEQHIDMQSTEKMLQDLPGQIDEIAQNAKNAVSFASRMMEAYNYFTEEFKNYITGVAQVDYSFGDLTVYFGTNVTAQDEDWDNSDSQISRLAEDVNNFEYPQDRYGAVSAYLDDRPDGSNLFELSIKLFDKNILDSTTLSVLNAANEDLDLM